MTRVEMVRRLLGEGLSRNTLVNLTDKQLNSLCERMLNEELTKQVKVYSMNNPKDAEAINTIINDPKKVADISKQGHIQVTKEEKTKPTKKQLSALDKNKNGKIDKEDFKLLRSKKTEMKEGEMSPVKKVINRIFKKHELKPYKTITTGVRGFTKSEGTGYKYEYAGLVSFRGVSEELVNQMANEMKEEGVIVGAVRKSGIEFNAYKLSNEDNVVNENDKKWIQKALRPSKKGSLKKALGAKKDETIPAGKLKAAAKKGGKLGQRARLAKTLKNLKETKEIRNWVEDIVENNYHPFTSKNEIMELIKTKLNEVETAAIPMPSTKAKKGHNGVPEFMTYDSIMSSSETKEKPAPTETPVREKPIPTPGEKPKKPSYIPGPGPDHKPKALSEKKSLKNGNK